MTYLATYREYGRFVGAAITVLHSSVLATFDLCQFHVDLAWCAQIKQRTLHEKVP